jgi:hypothetical protein
MKGVTLGKKDFQLYISIDGVICRQKIIKSISQNTTCTCVNRKISKMAFYLDVETPACDKCSWSSNLVVFVFCRLGFEEIEPSSLVILQKLLESEFYIGGYTGEKNSAYYLAGFTGKDYIYLDPHYVQAHQQNVTKSNCQSYEVKSVRKIKDRKMIVSAGLGFLLHSFEDFDKFWTMMHKLSTAHQSDFFFCLEDFEDDYQLDD